MIIWAIIRHCLSFPRDLVREISLAVKPRDLVKVYKAAKMVILSFLAQETEVNFSRDNFRTTSNMNKDRR